MTSLQLSDVVQAEIARTQQQIELAATHERARRMILPTNDKQVQLKLRELAEPIILFGEGAAERRDRLKAELTKRQMTNGLLVTDAASSASAAAVASATSTGDDDVVYTRGSPELLEARRFIATMSLTRAKQRVDAERQAKVAGGVDRALPPGRAGASFAAFSNQASEVGSVRPLSGCALSPDDRQLAVTDWTGACKVWNVADCKLVRSLAGHADRAHHVVYHTEAREPHSSAMQLATCGADETVLLWSAASDQAPLAPLAGHRQRVNRLALHPSGRFLASTSHDETWRLWDIETARELLVQDGHVAPVYGIAMQCDGSLVVTGALNAVALAWDLRTGKQVWSTRQHVKEVLTIDFSPSGFEFATGSADNVVRIFDLRQRELRHTIAAHQSLVSQVRYDRARADYLLSAGFDKKLNAWCLRGAEPTLAATLAGHEGKIMAFDVTRDDSRIVTAAFDRTFKFWH
jgi:U4/U6 small nuclear ribonucleoprotein PRP4